MAVFKPSSVRTALAFAAAVSASVVLSGQAPRPTAPAQPRRPARPAPPRPGAPQPPAQAAPAPQPPVSPDLVVTTSYKSGDAATTSTASFKGARARIDLGGDLASIQQCDAARTIQVNTRTKTYLAAPFDTGQPPAPTTAEKTRGGQLSVKTTVTDTGEKQDILGFPARRLKTLVVKESSADACDKTPERIETDGWYIEVPATVTCVTLPNMQPPTQADPQRPDCIDTVAYAHDGPTAGYPVRYTTTVTTGTAAPVTTTMEATEIKRADVPSEAVDVPQDYLLVRSVSQLTADHRPGEAGAKKPGVTRVGVAPVVNKTDADPSTDELGEALLESLSESDFEFVRLTGTSASEIEADARTKECDLMLQNTITELKVSRAGMMSRLSGSSGESYQAKVDFALVVPGQAKPAYSSSERSGASTFTKAIVVAKKAAQFAPPVMMARYGYMNAYGSLLNPQGAATSGAMMQSSDPVLNSAFALLDRATGTRTAAAQYGDEEAAVASALEKEVRAIFNELTKRKK